MPISKFFFLFVILFLLQINYTLACKHDSDCKEFYLCNKNTCVHKRFFPNPHILEILAFILVFIFTVLGSVAGIGGGLFFVPVLIVFSGFTTSDAVPISHTIIFLIALNERHPTVDKPVIDYNIAALLLPSIILGTTYGVLLNRILQTWLVLIIFIVVMAMSLWKTIQKAIEHYRIENLQKESENNFSEILLYDNNYENQIEFVSQNKEYSESKKEFEIEFLNPEKERLKNVEIREARNIYWDKVAYILIAEFFILLIAFVKGSKHYPSFTGLKLCSAIWWILSFIFTPIALILIYFIAKKLHKEHEEKLEVGYKFPDNELKLDFKSCAKLSILGIFIGIIVALTGIGGGIITGPVLLHLKMEPRVQTFTTGFMAIFTALSAMIQFILLGSLFFDYSIIGIVFGLLGSFVGVFFVLGYFNRLKRQSFIVMTLAFILICAIAMSLYEEVQNMIRNKHNDIINLNLFLTLICIFSMVLFVVEIFACLSLHLFLMICAFIQNLLIYFLVFFYMILNYSYQHNQEESDATIFLLVTYIPFFVDLIIVVPMLYIIENFIKLHNKSKKNVHLIDLKERQINLYNSIEKTNESLFENIDQNIDLSSESSNKMNQSEEKPLKLEENLCEICCQNKKEILFYKCGHIVCCEECAKIIRRDSCPICRKIITDIVKIREV